jgi:nuclear pore complex protein Nup160
MHGHLLTSSKEEIVVHGSPDMGPTSQNHQGNAQWETLELYLVRIFCTSFIFTPYFSK